MTSTTPFPEVYEQQLEQADLTTADFKGIPGGALHKVFRWSFEKQGLFQPGAAPGQPAPVASEGLPPDVDVYIDDGRHGEYGWQPNHWSCQDMWVRRAADGGTAHQHPVIGRTNYMYVRVKSRGRFSAQNVRVDAYHCLPGAGLSFPDDWEPMDTPSVAVAAPIAPGAETIVGPLAFVPTQVGHECLLAIAQADGDPGNDTTLQGTIPEYRFVPFDNNIGQRNVSPVYPSLREILKLLGKHRLWIRNPWDRSAVVRIEPMLPPVLRKLGWKMTVTVPRRSKFKLGARERREVVLTLRPGKELTPELLNRVPAHTPLEIAVRVYIDDELAGGMSYPLSLRAARGARDLQDDQDETVRPQDPGVVHTVASTERTTVDEVLELVRRDPSWLGGRGVRTVRLEFDLDTAAAPVDNGADNLGTTSDDGVDADLLTPERDPDVR
jgi:hypothetical protein